MKKQLSFFLIFCIAGTLSACTKNGTGTPVPTPQPYTITETFESGTKTAYAAANVSLITGSWNFDDALIGSLATDVKNGNKSVRLRNGMISMNFDIHGLTMLYISHAKYGNDASSVWQLFISSDSGVTYRQLGSDITENNTTLATDSFAISTTSGVRFQIRKAGTTRINIDDITFKGTRDPGIIIGIPDSTGVDTTGTSQPAQGRGTPVAGTDAPPATGDNSNLLYGNPSNAQPDIVSIDNYLIDQHYYTESYNSTRSEPNWVSWHLGVEDITSVATRQNNFASFTGLPGGWYQVQSNSYSGSGFDRGHNCPSADRTSSTEANSATFLMTNMIPQAPQNNQQTWANLENYIRVQIAAGNEAYIIMGSYGTGGTGSGGSATTINNSHVTVPSNIWKIAVILPAGNDDINRVSVTTRVIAVNTPNVNTIDSDWKKYIVTVRDIEKATGYNLLSNLPQSVQDIIETKKDAGN
jgi:endonuclease G